MCLWVGKRVRTLAILGKMFPKVPGTGFGTKVFQQHDDPVLRACSTEHEGIVSLVSELNFVPKFGC